MSEPAEAVTQVLDLLRLLYDRGIDAAEGPARLLAELDDHGFKGITAADADLFLTIGVALRLLLRHANAGVDEMFAATRAELIELAGAAEPDLPAAEA